MTGDQLDYLLGFVASLVSSVLQHQLQHYFLYRIKTEKGFMALVSHSLVVVWIHVQCEERPRHPQVYQVIRHFQKEKGIGVDIAIFVWPWKMVSVCSLFVFSAIGWKDQDMDSSLSRQRKPLYGEGIVRLANRVAVWRQSEVRLISRKFFGHDVFSAERSLNQPKPTSVCIRSTN